MLFEGLYKPVIGLNQFSTTNNRFSGKSDIVIPTLNIGQLWLVYLTLVHFELIH